MHPVPPKDIQVLIRKGDHNGVNSLITNVSLQQFRQMIGLQYSSTVGYGTDRRSLSSSSRTSNVRRPYSLANPNHPPLSSS